MELARIDAENLVDRFRRQRGQTLTGPAHWFDEAFGVRVVEPTKNLSSPAKRTTAGSIRSCAPWESATIRPRRIRPGRVDMPSGSSARSDANASTTWWCSARRTCVSYDQEQGRQLRRSLGDVSGAECSDLLRSLE
jgi:hypothetical protein